MMRTRSVLFVSLVVSISLAPARADRRAAVDWDPPTVMFPERTNGPVIACTPDEWQRLRKAWQSSGPEHQVIQARIDRAESHLDTVLEFPPRGGQHNQWYQCEGCQLGLKTLSDTQHQCPKCEKIYSGEPYDDVLFSRKHAGNVQQALDCAWACALTGESRYAERARAVLVGYADRYRAYPYHDAHRRDPPARSGGHLQEQTLGEATMMTRCIAPAFDLLMIGETLGEKDREHIRANLIRPMLENLGKHRAGKSNWQTWHNAAMVAGGAVLGDPSWVQRAITDEGNGFVDQMRISVTDDGMWYENSWGYHFYTLGAMVEILEGARRLGVDLWSHPRLKQMFTLPMQYRMPGGMLPRFGDDVNSWLRSRDALYEPAYAAYGDPAMGALLPAEPTWLSIMHGRDPSPQEELPAPQSALFLSAGHAILRTQGEAGLAAAMTFGPYGGFHGHLDKLSFVFYGYERELGVDPGRARSQAYRLPIHREWYKATIGHNAVLVDGRSQAPAAGRLVLHAFDDEFALVMAACDEAYKGVAQKRLLAMTPEYLLVVDQLQSDDRRACTWVYHNEGKRASCDQVTTPVDLTGAEGGFRYMQDTRRDAVTSPAQVRFEGEGRSPVTHLRLAWSGRGEMLLGDGPKASVLERVPLVMLEARGEAMWFAGLLEPVPAGREPFARALRVEPEGPDRLDIRVGHAAGEDHLELTPEKVILKRHGHKRLEGRAESSRR